MSSLNLTPGGFDSTVADVSSLPPIKPTKLEAFAKTATAARMSGTYHEAAGFLKRTFGTLSADSALEISGRNEQLLGKVHRLVSSIRGARNAALGKLGRARLESQALCRKHGGRLLDDASEFIDELQEVFLK